MKRLFILLLIFIQYNLIAQTCKLLNELKLTGNAILTDQLDNVYIIDGQIFDKYDLSGKKIAEYSNKQLGNITSADVSDPFRIILFYKDFNQLVILDNFLSKLGSNILLDQLGVERTESICSASSGGFWLFDGQDNRLLYYDKSLSLIYKSIDISSVIDSIGIPTGSQEINTFVYLNIPLNGILIFDRFGNYLKTIPLKNVESFQVYGGKLLILQAKVAKIYDLDKLTEETLSIDRSDLLSLGILRNNKCIALKKDKTEVYEIIP